MLFLNLYIFNPSRYGTAASPNIQIVLQDLLPDLHKCTRIDSDTFQITYVAPKKIKKTSLTGIAIKNPRTEAIVDTADKKIKMSQNELHRFLRVFSR